MQKQSVLSALTVLLSFAIVIAFFHNWVLTY